MHFMQFWFGTFILLATNQLGLLGEFLERFAKLKPAISGNFTCITEFCICMHNQFTPNCTEWRLSVLTLAGCSFLGVEFEISSSLVNRMSNTFKKICGKANFSEAEVLYPNK